MQGHAKSSLDKETLEVLGDGDFMVRGYRDPEGKLPYIDLFLAGLLATGATSADRFAQMFYLLPIGLFGVSVATALGNTGLISPAPGSPILRLITSFISHDITAETRTQGNVWEVQ